MLRRLQILPLVGLMFVLGCGEAADVSTLRHSIEGGMVDTQTTSVVGLLIQREEGSAICTGTVIAPNLVLTAQHCISQNTPSSITCGSTPFGGSLALDIVFATTRSELTNSQSDYRGVAQFHTPPGSDDTCGFDIAILELATPIPAGEAPPLVPRIDSAPADGENYLAIGYGHTGSGDGSGTRRSRDGRIVECVADGCSSSSTVQSNEWQGNEGTCTGDSGGPAIDAQGRVIGVLGRGPENCGFAVYSGIWQWSTWLRDVVGQVAARSNYEEPSWVTTGSSEPPDGDMDGDGVPDSEDICPTFADSDQTDTDADGLGDACDVDDDNDEVEDRLDNCARTANPDQMDSDEDGIGDACDDGIQIDAGNPPPDNGSPNDNGLDGNERIDARGTIGCQTGSTGVGWLSLLLIGFARTRR